jgi:hypothetical protein
MRPVAILVLVAACSSKGDSEKKPAGRRTEAADMLHQLEKRLKQYYGENGSFPKGKAGPLPTEDCCKGQYAKCAIVPPATWAADPIWAALDFHVDEPGLYHYSYESDGTSFELLAVGDVDCDTQSATFRLAGKAGAGDPVFTYSEPPPGVY